MPKTDYKTLYNREVEKNNKLSDELNYYKDLVKEYEKLNIMDIAYSISKLRRSRLSDSTKRSIEKIEEEFENEFKSTIKPVKR